MAGDRPEDALPAHVEEWIHDIQSGISEATEVIEHEIVERISLRDHSLKELAALDHPYRIGDGASAGAVRDLKAEGARPPGFVGPLRGKWRTAVRKAARIEREGQLGHGLGLVHSQSGDMLEALKTEYEVTDGTLVGNVGFDVSQDETIPYVLKGTRKMIGRDVISAAVVATRGQVLGVIRRVINNYFTRNR